VKTASIDRATDFTLAHLETRLRWLAAALPWCGYCSSCVELIRAPGSTLLDLLAQKGLWH
jgi:hypothetical protein